MRTLIADLATLRAVVGFLGEADQFNWWKSAFFSSVSQAFLKPIYPRTILVAQGAGVTMAAALAHDDRIGIGDVYHLFRLPEDMEQDIHRALHEQKFEQEIRGLVSSQENALTYLRTFKKDADIDDGVSGAVLVGDLAAMRKLDAWRRAAGYYLAAFETEKQSFPYFGNRT